MIDWRTDVVAAVDAWLAAVGGGRSEKRWHRVGEAKPTGEDGWYAVDVRDSRSQVDQLDRLQLGEVEPPDKVRGYAVVDAAVEGTQLRVRAGDHVPAEPRVLWAQVSAPGYLVKSLRDRLDRMEDPGLADALARGRAAQLPRPFDRGALAGDWRAGQRRA